MRWKLSPSAAPAPEDLARIARLRYVSDEQAGLSRRRNGSGFLYLNGRNVPLRDPRKLKRIEQLAIPPAWREVWICPFADGHLQATGRDNRRRKQYLYHARWREVSNLVKFYRLRQFGRLLPRLRRELARVLSGSELDRNRVLAGMVALLDATSIRIGNEEYARDNNSFGLASLRKRHLAVGAKGRFELRFRAKGGVRNRVAIHDPLLSRFLQQCHELAGSRLFQYIDQEGKRQATDAIDVNDFLRESTRHPFTAKDFRTWKASALVAGYLFQHRRVAKVTRRKRVLKDALAAAADLLGNTTTVCRKYYIHPGLLESYEKGTYDEFFARFARRRRLLLTADEQVLTRFLGRWEISLPET